MLEYYLKHDVCINDNSYEILFKIFGMFNQYNGKSWEKVRYYPKELYYEITKLAMIPPNKNNKFFKNGGPLFWEDMSLYENF